MKVKMMMASLTLLATSVSASPFEKPEDAIHYRQAAFSMIAANFGDMADMVKGRKDWNQEVFSKRAQYISTLALMPGEAFSVDGSDKGDTKAKPEIWNDWDGFTVKLNKFQTDLTQLAQVASQGDERATKKAFGVAAKNCKACHSDYKFR
ncbi:c-type cytochrome [Photobacterium sanguinicancri]|uniref:Cytochrome C n=1 Tax=Photobacterium sanguinicancri TaxID=875932 RepID=A0AAW7Y7K0_9GAMM|nr:cytochrome c [Photobacterium sanguinicancri]KXI23496.1 cytochrome C [Photobacterium sanguinicancri]MDO6499177.1 cytochrome c [Photobacterium sanguinicancri]MDO6542734.1 cytochrome c [Photobacterium sanguinicancri]OZS43005.1 cytochrome C [Photobacterium sanguinicancri]